MSHAKSVALVMPKLYTLTDTDIVSLVIPITLHPMRTSMNPESVTLDYYDNLRYDACTSEELQWAYGSEDYLSPRLVNTVSIETEMF